MGEDTCFMFIPCIARSNSDLYGLSYGPLEITLDDRIDLLSLAEETSWRCLLPWCFRQVSFTRLISSFRDVLEVYLES